MNHNMEYYRRKEQEVFPRIPGMVELLQAPSAALTEKYPDAAFALMAASDILTGDRERNAIHQQAYFDILAGRNIPEVRRRYQKAMDQYMQDHRWDD